MLMLIYLGTTHTMLVADFQYVLSYLHHQQCCGMWDPGYVLIQLLGVRIWVPDLEGVKISSFWGSEISSKTS